MTIGNKDALIEKVNQNKRLSQNYDEDAWQVLIVDDEESIHQVTKLVFRDFVFEGKKLNFFSAYSAEEAKEILSKHPDICLILLDVVMEKETSGLDFVKYLREEIKNTMVRVILRTGQPGHAPEKKVILDYDINDYKEKTELTKDKFYTAVVMGLRSFKDLQKIRESKEMIENIAAAMNRFIPHAFFKLLNKENILQIQLGDCIEIEMTVLFLDIESFTQISESLSPIECFRFINILLSHLEPAIIEYQGFIDKYVGDAIMALYDAPPDKAVFSALKILASLKKLNEILIKEDREPVNIGIGIDCGLLAIGTVGFHDRMDFTAISDTVNIAARLEKLNREYGSHLLITDKVIEKMTDSSKFNYRHLGKIKLKGQSKATSVYEIFDVEDEDCIQLKIQTRKEFEKAIHFYEENKLDSARGIFEKIVQLNPKDIIAKKLLDLTKSGSKDTELLK